MTGRRHATKVEPHNREANYRWNGGQRKGETMTWEGNRRRFFGVGLGAVATAKLVISGRAAAAERNVPADDPLERFRQAWTARLPWDRIVDLTTVDGANWDERLERAQVLLAHQGGGVVYFPPGEYSFHESIRLRDGIILRGAAPEKSDARSEAYAPPSRIVFPKYMPIFSGDGTPVASAFKGIVLDDPAGASNCGVVFLAIDHGHIHFAEAEEHRCGSNRFVCGCVLTNAAVCSPDVPNLSVGQKPWQRFTQRHFAAIGIYAEENVLVAANRLPPSDHHFVMPDYVLRGRGKSGPVRMDVVFDYDNRPGIKVNHFCIGAPGGEEPSGTPETHPFGFRKGTVIVENYIYSTGRAAIAFAGDGVVCAHNVIRFKDDVYRPTTDGIGTTSGSSTNDNRAVEMRGYRWILEGNDYRVYRNWAADRKYKINDGEGLMHENHCNSAIVDSVLVGNRGNTYLSLYKTGRIDGLLVENNDIRVDEKSRDGVNRTVAIMVDADHSPERRGPCRNVKIVGNTTSGGILLGGKPSSKNEIRDNKNVGTESVITLRAEAMVKNNRGYRVEKA